MSSLRSKAKFSFMVLLTLSAVLVGTVLIANFSGLISLEFFDSQNDLDGRSIDAAALPDILVGGSDGDIYLVRQDSKARFLGSVEDDIQDIERSRNQIFVATIKGDTQSEDAGNSDGKIMKFNTNGKNLLFLNRIFSSPDQTLELGGQLLDLEVVRDKMITASHAHDSRSRARGIYKGKISILDRESLDIRKEIELEAASDVKTYEDIVLTYGVDSEALILEKKNLSITSRFNINGTLADIDTHGNSYYITSTKKYEDDGEGPNPPTTTHGYISKYSKSGEELVSVDQGITARPREIIVLEEDLAIVNEYSNQKIKFVNFTKERVTDAISLKGRPERLVKSGKKVYTVVPKSDLLYIIDLEDKSLETTIKINGISTISDY